MGIFRFEPEQADLRFEEKPKPERLKEIGASVPPGSRFLNPAPDKPFVASMGIYVFTRDIVPRGIEHRRAESTSGTRSTIRQHR